jgi:DMSO/TMAO reductase YedYZ molybdopterin-dependent catalytic subunit
LTEASRTSTPLIIISLMVVIVAIYGVSQFNQLGQTDYVEIRDYQGVRLSSINDFRENSIKGPQKINITNYKIEIYGLVETPINYTYSEVLDNFPSQRKVVTLNCVEGWSATVLWEGVEIMGLVRAANPSTDAEIIIFHAEDGYTTSLPIDYIRDNNIILAYKINEVILPDENGFPFQLVAESKWGYKWCRWVTGLEFSDDATYEGYWERRGYSNSADLDDSFWGK